MAETIQREKQTIDATNQSLGRIATQVAHLLRGKHRPTWVPHIDSGDFVEIINIDKLQLTGNKRTGKIYYWHTGHPGGIKEETFAERVARKGYETVLSDTIYTMLPNNRLRARMMKRLSFKRSAS